MRIPMVDLAAQRRHLEPGLTEAISAVLDHQQFVLGPEVGAIETALEHHSGARAVVTCANGTDALVLALRALAVPPGADVVVPSFTFAATAEAVRLVGARPVFGDIQSDTFTIDVDAIRRHLASHLDAGNPMPVGVIAVDLFGHPADHDALDQLASEVGWWVLTDAAQSYGATSEGRRAGTLGTLVTTSFFPSKPLGCYGDGGAVISPDGTHAELLRSLRNHGAGADRYDNVRIGTNSRLDSIQAAVLLQKLKVLDEELTARERVAARYTDAFTGTAAVPPVTLPGQASAWAQYTIRCPRRDAVTEALDAVDVAWAVHYRSVLPDQAAFSGSPILGSLPVARAATAEVLSLPMHPYLSAPDQDRVIDVVCSALADLPVRHG